ncbi:LysM peptidoglycan-binding domain-containing protein [Arthrobacter sp. LjRoot14]|uniref:LysM peptidoglycan-binding domain-containing protein n=1 Tax=Arthrobacter sp. LjRoot14 TaxID=3342265 RepID=UPI003F4F4F24
MSATSAIHGSRFKGSAGQGRGPHASEFPGSAGQEAGASGIRGFNWEERPAEKAVKAAKARSTQPPLRLTRRGRIVLVGVPLILLAVLVISLAGFLNSPAKAADSASELSVTPTVSVTVQPGQSLWEIAGSVAPERDTRDVVADIVQLNNLDGGRVMPGQQIFVPSN